MYWDANNLCGWIKSQKLPADNFRWKKKSMFYYEKNSYKAYIFETDVEFPELLHKLHNDPPFLSQRLKLKKGGKIVCNLFDQAKYVAHITALK